MQYSLPFGTNHTYGHVDCQACLVMKQKAMTLILPEMEFEVAAKAFYALQKVDVAPERRAVIKRDNTLKGYVRHTESLKLFFAGMALQDIHYWNMRAYQVARVDGSEPFWRFRRPQDAKPRKGLRGELLPPRGKTSCPAKPQQVNQELDHLKRIKRLAGCWTTEDEKYYLALQEEESDAPRALSIDEQEAWLDTSHANPRWEVIYLYSLIAFDTCCSPNELGQLRLGDVRLQYGMISIAWPSAKNKYRRREIAIEDTNVLEALDRLLGRAYNLGAGRPASHPTNYLFPFRDPRTREYDPGRPMSSSGLKRLWQEVRIASNLLWFRREDTRHTGATRLAEYGTPTDIIVKRMGHCSQFMREHYTHIGLQAQRYWLRKGPQRVGSTQDRQDRRLRYS